ncbi:hypothetical protein LCGC14_1324540 [marine sediment metagenome]|uniref:Uncharacterized protein n=1 Tax=marine sediment metagenome TaxID=412755 RepID=A0A0F9MZD9_9ZZZZ
MLKLKFKEDTVTILEGEDTTEGKMLTGVKGSIRLKTPFGDREINRVKNKKGKILKNNRVEGR